MPGLEDLTPEQQAQALRLFEFTKANPDIEKMIRREAKKKNPGMAAPDIELEDALAAQRADFDKKLADQAAETIAERQQTRRSEEHARIRAEGLDPAAVEKCMVDNHISSYDTAIRYMKAESALAPATHDSSTPISLPDMKGLWEDKTKFARTTAFDAINDLKSGRVRVAR